MLELLNSLDADYKLDLLKNICIFRKAIILDSRVYVVLYCKLLFTVTINPLVGYGRKFQFRPEQPYCSALFCNEKLLSRWTPDA